MRDRLLLAALRAVPAPLARHVMFLLRTHPDLPDRWGHHVRPIHWGEPLPDFREITALHWLCSDHRDELRASWPAAIVDAGGPQGPASFWMTRVG